MGDTTGIAGLPGGGSTMVSGLPVAVDEEQPPPDWPLSLVMTAVAALVALLLISTEWGAVDPTRAGTRPAVPALPAGSTEKGSYLNPETFGEALAELRSRTGGAGRVRLMSVKADQVWAVVDVGTEQRVIRITGDGVTDDESGDADGDSTPIAAIDVQAPQRIVRGLRERFGIPPERIDFISLAGWAGTWGASLKRTSDRETPPFYSADEHGRKLVRSG